MAAVNEIINSKSRLIDCSLAVNVADSMFSPSIGHYACYLVWGYSQYSSWGRRECADLKSGLLGRKEAGKTPAPYNWYLFILFHLRRRKHFLVHFGKIRHICQKVSLPLLSNSTLLSSAQFCLKSHHRGMTPREHYGFWLVTESEGFRE